MPLTAVVSSYELVVGELMVVYGPPLAVARLPVIFHTLRVEPRKDRIESLSALVEPDDD